MPAQWLFSNYGLVLYCSEFCPRSFLCLTGVNIRKSCLFCNYFARPSGIVCCDVVIYSVSDNSIWLQRKCHCKKVLKVRAVSEAIRIIHLYVRLLLRSPTGMDFLVELNIVQNRELSVTIIMVVCMKYKFYPVSSHLNRCLTSKKIAIKIAILIAVYKWTGLRSLRQLCRSIKTMNYTQ